MWSCMLWGEEVLTAKHVALQQSWFWALFSFLSHRLVNWGWLHSLSILVLNQSWISWMAEMKATNMVELKPLHSCPQTYIYSRPHGTGWELLVPEVCYSLFGCWTQSRSLHLFSKLVLLRLLRLVILDHTYLSSQLCICAVYFTKDLFLPRHNTVRRPIYTVCILYECVYVIRRCSYALIVAYIKDGLILNNSCTKR